MKYFAISDIHSFCHEMLESLLQAGFDKNNSEHTLIVNGDVFDRGYESKEVFDFLKSLDDDRLILIKGNHEELFLQAVARWEYYHKLELNGTLTADETEVPLLYQNDLDNGTLRTIASFAHMPEPELYEFKGQYEALKRIHNSEVVKWLKSKKWLNYYELGPYIFTHSFIPLHNRKQAPVYNANWFAGLFTYFKNWRTQATRKEWSDSRWGCPWKQYKAGLFNDEAKNGKILVCGHWHTSDFFKYLKNIPEHDGIYFSKNLIGLDNGVSYNYIIGRYIHKQNVLVIDENMVCYDGLTGKPLTEPEAAPKIETVSIDEK